MFPHAARPTGEFDPASGAQAHAHFAGGHADVRVLMRGLAAEPLQPGRSDGRAQRSGALDCRDRTSKDFSSSQFITDLLSPRIRLWRGILRVGYLERR